MGVIRMHDIRKSFERFYEQHFSNSKEQLRKLDNGDYVNQEVAVTWFVYHQCEAKNEKELLSMADTFNMAVENKEFNQKNFITHILSDIKKVNALFGGNYIETLVVLQNSIENYLEKEIIDVKPENVRLWTAEFLEVSKKLSGNIGIVPGWERGLAVELSYFLAAKQSSQVEIENRDKLLRYSRGFAEYLLIDRDSEDEEDVEGAEEFLRDTEYLMEKTQ